MLSPYLGKAGLTCERGCGRVVLAPGGLHPVEGHWAQAPGPGAVLRRPGHGMPPLAQALGLATGGHQKEGAVSGLWPLSCAGWPPAGLQDCCYHHLCGCSGQRLQAQVGAAHVEAPGNYSCTPPPRRSYWHCHGSHHTRSGYTGPQRQRSTSGQPSLCRSHGHWAAGTAQGMLRGGSMHVTTVSGNKSANAAWQSPASSTHHLLSLGDLGKRPFPVDGAHLHPGLGP